MKELEAVLWCRKCGEEKGRLFRIPAENEHVFQHVTEPPDLKKTCECGTNLERKR